VRSSSLLAVDLLFMDPARQAAFKLLLQHAAQLLLHAAAVLRAAALLSCCFGRLRATLRRRGRRRATRHPFSHAPPLLLSGRWS
jgi:hypothetical protein